MNTITTTFATSVLHATKGMLYCGGNYSKFTQNAIWNIRNFNTMQSIYLNSVKIIDATGIVLYDSTIHPAGIPLTNNGLLGGLDNELQANQSSQFRSQQLVAASMLPNLPQHRRPVQLIIKWSAIEKVIGLEGSLVRTSHMKKTVETSPGIFITAQGREIGRHQYDCRNQKL